MKRILLSLLCLCVAIVAVSCAQPTMQSSPQTYQNLLTANAGETNAANKYSIFAPIAATEGNVNAYKLFTAAQEAETIHATKQLAIANEMQPTQGAVADEVTPGDTAQNLQTALEGETYEYTQMYPPFYDTAIAESNRPAEKIFKYAMKAETQHAVLFDDLLNNPSQTETTYYLCPVCGNIEKGNAPMFCSVCGSPGFTFQAF